MLNIKNVTIRNFLSVGNVSQTVIFDKHLLTLILGDNLDMGGNGSRNGVGKSALLNALCYGWFGVAVSDIRKDFLINKTNAKNMLVTVEFEMNGKSYKIERGRKPNIFKFLVDNNEIKNGESSNDEAQGESKLTQQAIEKVLGFGVEMFKHIIGLNTYTLPFLALKAAEQREIIEQLLGITQLSEKALVLKELIKNIKDSIKEEEFKIKAQQESNNKIESSIQDLIKKSQSWVNSRDYDVQRMQTAIQELENINIDVELSSHKELAIWHEQKTQQDAYNALIARSNAWQQKHNADIQVANKAYLDKNSFNIEPELQAWVNLKEWTKSNDEQKQLTNAIDVLKKSIGQEQRVIAKLEAEILSLEDHKCYACGQDFHDTQHNDVISTKRNDLTHAKEQLTQLEFTLGQSIELVKDIGINPITYYKTETEAIRHSSDLANLKKSLEDKETEVNPFLEQLSSLSQIELGQKPTVFYSNIDDAISHKTTIDNLYKQLESKLLESDPYHEQAEHLRVNALSKISWDNVNQLSKLNEHQEFLLKLLTNKDSFIRKRIIEQNLGFLNHRMEHYLTEIGLPHQVKFQSDLSVSIGQLGQEFDFNNLSRGERNRLVLSMSWAFRDVYENLNHSINLYLMDEVVDSGMDQSGVDNALTILKTMGREQNKNIFLVSHREELVSRVNNILMVTKENGFTQFNMDTEMVGR
jgi:DNA repair exonuclease SbcCD ATPase subunit